MNILFINCLCSLEIKDIMTNMIVILGMNIDLFFKCLCKFVTEDTFKTIEIGVSIGALIYAIRAFNQSIKAHDQSIKAHDQSIKARRYSSFETIFAQMLSVQRSFFDNQYMLNTKGIPLTVEFVSMFVYLRNQKKINSLNTKKDKKETLKKNKEIETLKKINNEIENSGEIDPSRINDKLKKWCDDFKGKPIDQLTSYYSSFIYDKSNVEYFKNCFKFIYNIVMLVEESEIDVKDKQLYIRRIQALLNRNEMFCYFVNLVEHGSKLKDKEKEKHNDYIVLLKNNSFFKDLDDKNGRFHEILIKIDSNLLEEYGIMENTNENM